MGYLHFKIWTESSLIFGCLKRSKIWIRTKLVYNPLPIRNTKAKKSPFPWDCEMRRDVRPFNYLYAFVAGARALIYNPDSFLDLTIRLYIPFIFLAFWHSTGKNKISPLKYNKSKGNTRTTQGSQMKCKFWNCHRCKEMISDEWKSSKMDVLRKKTSTMLRLMNRARVSRK